MSDPVKNVEIDDVLSSIRKLVSGGDKVNGLDTSPVDATTASTSAPIERSESISTPASADCLVLTPAFLVVDGQNNPVVDKNRLEDLPSGKNENTEDNGWHEEPWPQKPEADEINGSEEDDFSKPLPLTNMVSDGIDAPNELDATNVAATDSTEDRVGLATTIAELEAAISANDEEYEPDGGEDMVETIEWPGTVTKGPDDFEDAVLSDPEGEDLSSVFDQSRVDAAPERALDQDQATQSSADEYGDDDLDELPEVNGVSLDEEALRELVAEMVRQELTGPMGERITRNMRKLVRREVHRVLSSEEFD